MKYALAIAAISGLAAAANADTSINFESSVDGTNWAATRVVDAGTTVYVRMRVQVTGQTVVGFSGMTSQPVLSNWGAGDTRNGFTFPGLGNDGTPGTETAYDGKMTSAAPGTNTGRIFPFGTAGQGIASSSGLLSSFVDAGNRLRFAGSKNTTETTNVAWGLANSQNPASLMGTNFSSTTNATIFRYSVTMNTPGDHVASIVQISGAAVKWYLNTGGTSILTDTNLTINPGTITVGVPAPGALALLGLGGLAAGRRRRDRKSVV